MDGTGGVDGHTVGENGGWLLSTDTGCAFMGFDGLSHVYQVTRDERVLELLEEMTEVFSKIDKIAFKAQTHCTLTAGRGLARLYALTGDAKYLTGAETVLDLYVNGGGMTATYQNLNWWGKPYSWTEPCAIIDSMMLSGMLYEMTGKEKYRRLAARIWCNGFASAQRANGGAGADFIVLPKGQGGSDTLRMHGFEAEFCCSMRLAEGLWYASTHKDLLAPERDGRVTKRENGTYADGDILYSELIGDAGRAYLTETVTVDGHTLSPLLKYYRIPVEEEKQIAQRVIFD